MNFNIRDFKTYKRFTLPCLLILITLVAYSCNPLDDRTNSNSGFLPFLPPFSPAPSTGLQLTSIAPASGATAGGTAITITGLNFSVSGSTTVELGGVPATSIVVASDTSITAVTGAHVAGPVDVVVVGPNGSSNLTNGFTYVGPPVSTLTSIAPVSGTTLGGTSVTLTGTNLTGATDVTFDSVSATNLAVVNSTTVTVDAPAHAAGAVNVAITTPLSTATLTNAYTYILLPAITSISPTTSTTAGGTGFTLTGASLGSTTGVTFGGVSATSVVVVNSTTVTGVTPAHAAGAVNVVAVGPGNPTLTNGYTYAASALGQSVTGGMIGCLGGGLANYVITTTDTSVGITWGGSSTAFYDLDDGQLDTAGNVAALGANGGVPYASKLCDDFEVDSQGNTPCLVGNACYSDWFLPAANQVACFYNNKVALGIASSANYWTSSDFGGANAWAISLSNGSQFANARANGASVRCTRAFTP